MSPISQFYDRAFNLLESETIRKAMDITQEPPAIRERYGFGASPMSRGEVNGGGGEMGFARQMRGVIRCSLADWLKPASHLSTFMIVDSRGRTGMSAM